MTGPNLLTHLLVACAVVVAPAARVLCNTSCAPEGRFPTEAAVVAHATGTSAVPDTTPECHEAGEPHHPTHESDSVPLEDDCRHGGDSSSSSLFASVKAAKGDGVKVPVVSVRAAPNQFVAVFHTDREARSGANPAHPLGLVLTPLRL